MGDARILAVAAATGRVGYIVLQDAEPFDWGISDKAAKSPVDAAEVTQKWMCRFKPTHFVTEDTRLANRKGDATRDIIRAMETVGEHAYVLDIAMPHRHLFPSKYEEAAALGERFPIIAHLVPRKRTLLDNEPRETVIFEALSLAAAVLDGLALPDSSAK